LKFKYIFILFNVIIVLFIALLFIVSFSILQQGLAAAFLQSIWPLIALLAAMLIVLDCYYYINKRLFYLLECEDWPALVQYLEIEVFRKGHYTRRLVQLLANTYLVLSDSRSVVSLENKIAVVKPAFIEENALIFAAARLLSGDTAGAVNFLADRLGIGAVKGKAPNKAAQGSKARRGAKRTNALWVRFYYGLALLLDRRFPEAADQCMILCAESRNAAVTGLSAYFLSETISAFLPLRREELFLASEEGRKRVLKVFPGSAKWNRELSRLQNEIHTAILAVYINKATEWLYP
jgi:hypothetical protein